MAKRLSEITPELTKFIEKQPLFFVASAPLSGDGHVNLSPKGLDTFRVLGPNQVAYLDLTGSGNETAAHLCENGRLTFMFCAFSGPPKILRLFCTGRVVSRTSAEWPNLFAQFTDIPGIRQIIVGDVSIVQTSCGYAVPRMALQGERDQLTRYAEDKGEAGMVDYRRKNNRVSLDGLPAPETD